MINVTLQADGNAAMQDSIVAMVGRGETAKAIRLTARRYGYDPKQTEEFVGRLIG